MLSFVSSRLSSARFSRLVLTRRLLLLFLRSLRYLKSQRDFGDPFIAGMRGVSVVMGLLGTVVMPLLAKHVGLVRGGAWSLWFVPSPSLLLVSMRNNFSLYDTQGADRLPVSFSPHALHRTSSNCSSRFVLPPPPRFVLDALKHWLTLSLLSDPVSRSRTSLEHRPFLHLHLPLPNR